MLNIAVRLVAKQIAAMTKQLYLYPGGTIAPLLKACIEESVKLVVAKTEQGAGFMAMAEAKLYHRPAFVAVTSGPGASNLVTCIADAYYDSVPLVVLTGQVGTKDLARSPGLRQRGFQEIPIAQVVAPIVKKAFQPVNEQELRAHLQEAIALCQAGRKGPVLIDLPMDVQQIKVEFDYFDEQLFASHAHSLTINEDQAQKNRLIVDQFLSAKKPLVLLGAGAQADWAIVREWVTSLGLPVVSSVRGLGIVTDNLYQGWVGHTGSPLANKVLFEADALLVLGSRLDVRQTGTQVHSFNNKWVAQVDLDHAELSECRILTNHSIQSSVRQFIQSLELNELVLPISCPHWWSDIDTWKASYVYDDEGVGEGILPKDLLLTLDEELTHLNFPDTLITTGVGSHQQWVPRYVQFDNRTRRLFASAGHGTMGYGLPTALGLSFVERESCVICIDGDGSFQMNLQELALVRELGLKVKILIMDNQRLAIVSQFQNLVFGDDPTTGRFEGPELCFIAKAYGIEYEKMYNQVDRAQIRAWLISPCASILHVDIQHDAPVSPMLLAGQTLDQMWYKNASR